MLDESIQYKICKKFENKCYFGCIIHRVIQRINVVDILAMFVLQKSCKENASAKVLLHTQGQLQYH